MKESTVYTASSAEGPLAHRCARWFLLIGLPSLLLLCFLTPPFEVSDEPNHFKRAVALTSGEILPEVSLHDPFVGGQMKSAGGNIDTGVATIADSFVPQKRTGARMSVSKLCNMLQTHASGSNSYNGFSNTAIYPPMLYVGDMIGVVIGRVTDSPLLLWLYLGRVVSALLASAMIMWSLRRAGDAAPAMLVVALLPQCLFQVASVSADSILIGVAFVFVAVITRIATGERESLVELTMLSVATFTVCVGKVAYMPLAFLPPIITFLADRHWSRRVVIYCCVLFITLAIWASWAFVVRDSVFAIVASVPIDPKAQLAFMLQAPLRAVAILGKAMAVQAPLLLFGIPGTRLGWLDLAIFKPFIALSWIMLILTVAFSKTRASRISWVPTIAIIFAAFCYPVIFLLLYLQFNSVGSGSVEGVLSRYFVPLLLLVLCILPRRQVALPQSKYLKTAVFGWGVLSSLVTCGSVLNHYWSLPPLSFAIFENIF